MQNFVAFIMASSGSFGNFFDLLRPKSKIKNDSHFVKKFA
jgi:hypothetical protein